MILYHTLQRSRKVASLGKVGHIYTHSHVSGILEPWHISYCLLNFKHPRRLEICLLGISNCEMWGWSSKNNFFFKSHDILFLEFNTNVIEHWHDQRFIWTISKYINVHVYMNINVLRKHGWVNEWNFFCLKKVGKVTDFFDEWAIGITFYSHYRCTFTVMRDRWFVD